jgi:hypothetical protein
VVSLARQIEEDLKPLEVGYVARRLEGTVHEGFHPWVSPLQTPRKSFESMAATSGGYIVSRCARRFLAPASSRSCGLGSEEGMKERRKG